MLTEQRIINGKYRIQEEIGRGDLGPVYRATDEATGASLALRIVTIPCGGGAEDLEEAGRQILELNHPNVAPPGMIEKTPDGTYILVRDFVEGITLAQLISQAAPLPLPRACSLARQIALALESVHHAGLIHGDLKPANVLVAREGDDGEEIVKVLGFGTLPLKKAGFMNLAHLAAGVDGQPAFGTAEYLSPEQALGTSPDALDGRSDLYSLGVILYQMITAELPHQGGSPMEVLLAQIFAEAPSLAGRADLEVPLAVDTLLMRMLAKKRGDRPASATVVIDQLGPWEQTLASPHAPPVVPETAPAPEIPEPVAGAAPEAGAEMPVSVFPLGGASQPGLELPVGLHSEEPPLAQPLAAEFESPEASPARHAPMGRSVSFGARETPPAEEAGLGTVTFPESDSSRSAPRADVALEPETRDAFVADLPPAISAGPTLVHKPAETQLDVRLNAEARTGPRELPKSRWPSSGSGSVLFRELPARKKRKASHRVLKGFGVAAIVAVIVVGAACGWLYVTGRTYWFDRDYIKTRVSYYLSSGAPVKAPDTENVSQPSPGAPPAPITEPQTNQSPPAQRPTIRTKPAAEPPPPATHSPATSAAGPSSGEVESALAPTGPTPVTHAAASREMPEANRDRSTGAEVTAVQAAVTQGQYYFDRGDYDAALEVYQRCLARFPSNPELLSRIQRAKRAKAAEAKYLR